MKVQQVLLLNAQGLTAYRCRRGEAVAKASFSAANGSDFSHYLAEHAEDVYSVLVDLAEESFEFERLPPARGRSRSALIERKRNRHAHGSPLCLALPQGRERQGRRDERFLFAAMTHPEAIEPWLRALEAAEAAVAGLYSVAQIAAEFAGQPSGNVLLVAQTSGGLRQTFVVDGQLRFSRLSPLPLDATPDVATACMREAQVVHRYLCGRRLMEREDTLSVRMLLPAGQGDAFRQECRGTEALEFDVIDLDRESMRRGMTTPPSGSLCDALLAYLLASKPPAEAFAPKTIGRHLRLRRLRCAIDAVGLSALAASLLFAAVRLPLVLPIDANAQPPIREESVEQSALALPAEEARAIGLAYRALMRTSPDPSPALFRLSRAMDGLAAIELEAVEWRIETEHKAGPQRSVEVRGRVLPAADPDVEGESVARLAERLRFDPALHVEIVKPPFAADEQSSTGSTRAMNDGSFVLRITEAL